VYGREKLKGKNGEGGGKKGFDMDEELASVKEGSVTRGDKKRNDEEEKRERERRIIREFRISSRDLRGVKPDFHNSRKRDARHVFSATPVKRQRRQRRRRR